MLFADPPDAPRCSLPGCDAPGADPDGSGGARCPAHAGAPRSAPNRPRRPRRRPPAKLTEPLSLLVPPGTGEALHQAAEARGLSRADLLRRWIAAGLARARRAP